MRHIIPSYMDPADSFFFHIQIPKIVGGKLKEIAQYLKLFVSVVDPDPHGLVVLHQNLDP